VSTNKKQATRSVKSMVPFNYSDYLQGKIPYGKYDHVKRKRGMMILPSLSGLSYGEAKDTLVMALALLSFYQSNETVKVPEAEDRQG